jgi:hypothetical protein
MRWQFEIAPPYAPRCTLPSASPCAPLCAPVKYFYRVLMASPLTGEQIGGTVIRLIPLTKIMKV